eukprot:515342_1
MVIIFKTKYVVYVDHLMVMINDELLGSDGKQYLPADITTISYPYYGRVRLSRNVAVDSIVNDFSSTYVYFPPTLSPTSLTTPPTLTPTNKITIDICTNKITIDICTNIYKKSN